MLYITEQLEKMNRRKFINTSVAASTVTAGLFAAQDTDRRVANRELYEWRTYDLKWRGNKQILTTYLKDVLKPALMQIGVNHFLVFDDLHENAQRKIRVLISYPNFEIYAKAQTMVSEDAFVTAAADYNALPVDKPIYDRFESALLWAFAAQPQMIAPMENATVFELRIYEGYSEDAVRRKIKMFNDGEIPIFNDVGLFPIFFGEMWAGALRPCLVYMVHCKDMDAHTEGWQKFGKHPDWMAMKGKAEYANSVSNIRNAFLQLI